jgi:hypothetical protein
MDKDAFEVNSVFLSVVVLTLADIRSTHFGVSHTYAAFLRAMLQLILGKMLSQLTGTAAVKE